MRSSQNSIPGVNASVGILTSKVRIICVLIFVRANNRNYFRERS